MLLDLKDLVESKEDETRHLQRTYTAELAAVNQKVSIIDEAKELLEQDQYLANLLEELQAFDKNSNEAIELKQRIRGRTHAKNRESARELLLKWAKINI